MRIKRSILKIYSIFLFLFIGYYPGVVVNIVDIPYFGQFCTGCICVSFLYLLYFFIKKNNKLILWASIFFIYLNLVTLIKCPDELASSTVRMVKCLNIIYMVEYANHRYGYKYTVKLLLFVTEFLNYVNALSMIVFPNGLYRTVVINGVDTVIKNEGLFVRTTERVHWLLGHQSTLNRVILPAICLALIYAVLESNNKKVRKIFKIPIRSSILILVCIFEMIMANSAGNIVVIALFVILLFVQQRKNFIKIWYAAIFVVCFYGFSAASVASSFIIDFLSNLLGRSVDLLARLQIWAASLLASLKSPIIGLGYINEMGSIRNVLPGVGNPHSDYLWVLYEGGCIGVILFGILIFIVGRNCENKNGKIEIIAYCALLTFLFMILDDDHIFRAHFALILLPICFHAHDDKCNILVNKKGKIYQENT